MSGAQIILSGLSVEDLSEVIRTLIREEVKPASSPQIEIINRDELCKRLGITEPTAIRWDKKGKIPSIRIGTSIRYNWYSVISSLEKSK